MNPRSLLPLTLLILAAATLTPSRVGAQPAVGSEKLRPGDHLRFQIIEDEDAPRELVIGEDGSVEVPYLGPRPTAGRSLQEFAAEVKAALEADYYRHATVRVSLSDRPKTSTNRGRIFITGQVKRVGMVEIDRSDNNTVSKVILANGGLADFAEAKSVKIFRTDSTGKVETKIVDLHEVLENGRIDKDEPIRDGDLIVVDAKIVNW